MMGKYTDCSLESTLEISLEDCKTRKDVPLPSQWHVSLTETPSSLGKSNHINFHLNSRSAQSGKCSKIPGVAVQLVNLCIARYLS